jgi:hypothetical protein
MTGTNRCALEIATNVIRYDKGRLANRTSRLGRHGLDLLHMVLVGRVERQYPRCNCKLLSRGGRHRDIVRNWRCGHVR